jgi:hypothetical protein
MRYLRKNDGYIYYSAALVIHSSSIFRPRIPRIPRIPCHLQEPSISTLPLEVSNDDSPDLPSIVTLIVLGIAATALIAPEILTSLSLHSSQTC